MGKLKGEHTVQLVKRGAGSGRAKLGDDALGKMSLSGGTALGSMKGKRRGTADGTTALGPVLQLQQAPKTDESTHRSV